MVLKHVRLDGCDRSIYMENGKITAVTAVTAAEGIDAGGKTAIPGLVDVHTHGCAGWDTMDADFAPMCRYYAVHGTTAWLPTTMTVSTGDLQRVTAAKTNFPGAQILGFHLEGPYISAQYAGAQNAVHMQLPDVSEFYGFSGVRMVTLAPELPGSMEFIQTVSETTVVSIGHTACDYATALHAMECGASCLTHTFNAMPPLHHRAPGPIGAAVERRIYAQVIGDGLHVQKPLLLAAYRMFGADRMVLISDSIRPAGLPDGDYLCGGLPVTLKNGAARLPDGTLAGGISTLWDVVKTVTACGIPFADAVRMASQTPAELLKVPKGKIAAGYDADILLLNDRGNIDTVIIAGEIYYTANR